eukprot:6385650-Prymnesium_polylepis.1
MAVPCSIITNVEILQNEINQTLPKCQWAGPKSAKRAGPPPPAELVDDDMLYNGTLVLFFRDKLPLVEHGLHETLRQLRFIRLPGTQPNFYGDTSGQTIFHVIATTCDLNEEETVWLSPMGPVYLDEHQYVKETLEPYAKEAKEAIIHRARSASLTDASDANWVDPFPGRKARGRRNRCGAGRASNEGLARWCGCAGVQRRAARCPTSRSVPI